MSVPAVERGTHLRLYDLDGVTFLGFLPEFADLAVVGEHNDVGGLLCRYPLSGRNAALLRTTDVGFLKAFDGGLSPATALYQKDADNAGDEAGADRELTISADGTLRLLEWAIVYPEAGFNTAQFATFQNVTPGSMMGTLLTRAKARGTLDGTYGPNITPTFDATTDSAGVAWPQALWLRYDAGKSLLEVVLDLVERGFVDTRMRGFDWDLYIQDTELAADHPDLWVRRARELESADRERDRTPIKTALLATGDASLSTEVFDAAAATKFGRREGHAAQAGVTNAAVLTSIGTKLLTDLKRYKEGTAATYDLTAGGPQPWRDFNPGDFVRADWYQDPNSGVNLPVRARSITTRYDPRGGRTCEVELNDLFLEASIVLARRIKALTKGAVNVSTTTSPPVVADSTTPSTPSIVLVDSDVIQNADGRIRAFAVISWPLVTSNTDATVFDDDGGYRVSYSLDGSAYSNEFITQPGASVAYVSGLPPGSMFTARVAASDYNGHVSGYRFSAPVVLAKDTIAPPAPSQPTVTAIIGGLKVAWDGLTSTGASMPADFDHVQAYVSTVNNFAGAAPQGGPLATAGTITLSGLSYAQTYYVWLVAYDHAGNPTTQIAAVPSVVRSGIPIQVLAPDLGGGAVGPNALLYRDFGNKVPDGSFELAVNRTRLAADPTWAPAWSFVNAGAPDGGWVLRGTGSTAPNTNRKLDLITAVTCVTGAKIWFTFKAKGNPGTNGSAELVITVKDATGSTIATQVLAVFTADGSWYTPAGGSTFTYTFPSNAATYDVSVRLPTTVSAGTWEFDAVQVRDVMQTAIIDQAAIGTVQIADAAVGTAQIGKASIGALDAGTITATFFALGGGLLTTAAQPPATDLDPNPVPNRTGARVELDALGFRAYDSSSVSPSTGKTVSINSDGSAFFAGDISGSTGLFGGSVYAANLFAVNFDNLVQDAGLELTQKWVGVTAAVNAAAGTLYYADATAGGFTITLPAPIAGSTVMAMRVSASGGAVTVARSGAALIDGATSYTLLAPAGGSYRYVTFTADGTNWHAVSVVKNAPTAIGYWLFAATAGVTSLSKWSLGIAGSAARTGRQGANRSADGQADSIRYATYFPCALGDVYSASAWYYASATVSAGTTARVKLFWYDIDQTFLSSSSGATVNLAGGTGGAFIRAVVTDTPPVGAAYFRVDCWVSGFAAGVVGIDDMVARRVVSNEDIGNITGSKITGAQIVGGSFTTGADATQPRIYLTDTQFYNYILFYPGTAIHGPPEKPGWIRAYDIGNVQSVTGLEIVSGLAGSRQGLLTIEPDHLLLQLVSGGAFPDAYIESPVSTSDFNFYSSSVLRLTAPTHIYVSRAVQVESSAEVKTSVRTIASVLDDLARLRPVTFRRKGAPADDDQDAGFIAEEVAEVFPDLVSTPDYMIAANGERVPGVPHLATDGLTAYAIRGIQELDARLRRVEQARG